MYIVANNNEIPLTIFMENKDWPEKKEKAKKVPGTKTQQW